MTTTGTLAKAGKAYYANLDGGSIWVKRIDGTWHILHHFTNPNGDREWATLGLHATKAEALADATALIAA
jgi:hypothetical protein